MLSNFFDIGRIEWGICDANPVANVRKPKCPPGRDRRLTPREERLNCYDNAVAESFFQLLKRERMCNSLRVGVLSSRRMPKEPGVGLTELWRSVQPSLLAEHVGHS